MTRRSLALWCAAYTALSLIVTFPLVLHLSSVVPHDVGDPLLSASILWWNAHVVPLTERWWNGFAFHPSTGMMAFSDHRLGLSLVATPLQWLGCSPITAYNVVWLATFPLCAIAAHGLGFTLTKRHDASVICGLAYGFNPYRVAHLEHLELLAAFAMPAALATLHEYLSTRRLKWIVLFAFLLILQGLCATYYILFFGVLFALWMTWFTRLGEWRLIWPILAGVGFAALMLSPIAWRYSQIHRAYGFSRDMDEIVSFSADITSLITASKLVAVWGWTSALNDPEKQIFPGLTVVLLVIIGGFVVVMRRHERHGDLASYRRFFSMCFVSLFFIGVALSAILAGPWRVGLGSLSISVGAPYKPLSLAVAALVASVAALPPIRAAYDRRSAFAFYVLATLVLFACCLGPKPAFRGLQVLYQPPYAWLMRLPIFADGVRVPARFAMLAILTLSVAAALAFNRLKCGDRNRRTALMASVVGIMADAWIGHFPLSAVPRPWRLERARDFSAVLELPAGDIEHETGAMYRATFHQRPLVNGYSGYEPTPYTLLKLMLREQDFAPLDELASRGALLVAADEGADPERRWSSFLVSHPGVALIGIDNDWMFFSIAQRPSTPARCSGDRLTIDAISDNQGRANLLPLPDGDPRTVWSTAKPQQAGDRLVLDLGQPARACEAAVFLGPYLAGYPRALTADTSLDGAQWEHAYTGYTGGLTLRGALENPRKIPIRIPLQSVPARFVRLTLLGSDSRFPWVVADVVVTAAK